MDGRYLPEAEGLKYHQPRATPMLLPILWSAKACFRFILSQLAGDLILSPPSVLYVYQT